MTTEPSESPPENRGDLHESLQKFWGFDAFLPGQEAVIGHLMEGRSAAAVFPTGGGKSLCYQLTALGLPGLTLVVSPLIALMKDQIDSLMRRGIAARRLDSSLSGDEYREVMGSIRGGQLKLLYVAPERFNNERFRKSLADIPVSLFAVDEAHCISEWGHNFRPDYLKLAEHGRRFGAERVLALTATATPQVLEDICRGFEIKPDCAVRTSFYRENLTLLATTVAAEDRDPELGDRLKSRDPGSTIVYVTLQRTAEELAQKIRGEGFEAEAYHAGLDPEERHRVQERFLASDKAIVVATIAFGMGIDKSDIRYVYHYNLPKSLENYAQEIGRAGRDGEPSICEMLVCPDDLPVLGNFAYGDTPSRTAVQGFLGEIFAGDEPVVELNLYELAAQHDLRTLVLRTLLTYLELDGFLQASTPFYSVYRFQPKMSSQEILGRFSGERQNFLRDLFRQAKKARTWLDIDLDAASKNLGTSRDRLIRALDWLAEKEMLELKVAGVRYPYRRLKRPEDLAALAETLHRRTLDREEREIARLHQILELAGHDGCLASHLGEHFGEPLDTPCENCSWCLNGEALEIPPIPEPPIDEEIWSQAAAFRQGEPLLGEPRAFARFLAGLTSPALTRQKLTSHSLFGRLAGVPFPALLSRAEAEGGAPSPRPR